MINAEAGLAFIEGVALIASPCILPILPLILASSAEGGKSKSFGIITGFVLAFSLFAIASRAILNGLHIHESTIRNGSLLLLFIFGLIQISPRLSEKFATLTQSAANIGSDISNTKIGFLTGIFIGSLIGLIWTPCAGPILATALVQIIRQETDAGSILVLIAFTLGVAVPMVAIALTGRKILEKLGFLTRHAGKFRQITGGIILISVMYFASGTVVLTLINMRGKAPTTMHTGIEHALSKPYPAPELTGLTRWLNSPPLTLASLKGKVVLIDFWTYACANCIATLPYLNAWDHEYRDQGLVILSIHAPEYDFEKAPDNVIHAISYYQIKYPVALDNKLTTWMVYHNSFWPAHYLIDRNGNVIYTHFGEGDYDITENNIRYLLAIKP